jgi:hypothetical protein
MVAAVPGPLVITLSLAGDGPQPVPTEHQLWGRYAPGLAACWPRWRPAWGFPPVTLLSAAA